MSEIIENYLENLSDEEVEEYEKLVDAVLEQIYEDEEVDQERLLLVGYS